MRISIASFVLTMALSLGLTLGAETDQPAMPTAAAIRPNIVIVVSDDVGWGAVGWQNEKVKTPHLDQLAQEGLVLNRHYVAPICSPTRASLLTGRYWSRFGCNNWIEQPRVFPDGTSTIAGWLKQYGYRTCLLGKWHLGRSIQFGPKRYGFDHFYGTLAGGITPYHHIFRGAPALTRNGTSVKEEGHIVDLMTKEAIAWLKSGPTGQPFLLYLPFTNNHIPIKEPPAYMDLYPEPISMPDRLLWASMSHLDDAVGSIMSAIAELGEEDNTLVLYFGDNGSSGSNNLFGCRDDTYIKVNLSGDNRPFRGKKGDLYEGGIRTPAFLWWPGRIAPGESSAILHVADWAPTLCRLVGIRPAQAPHWDGRDIWPVLTGAVALCPPRTLYFNYLDRHYAVIHGDWKIIHDAQQGVTQLYNLATDPSERRDVSADNPDRIAELLRTMHAEIREDNAWPHVLKKVWVSGTKNPAK